MNPIIEVLHENGGGVDRDELEYQLEQRGALSALNQLDRLVREQQVVSEAGIFRLGPNNGASDGVEGPAPAKKNGSAKARPRVPTAKRASPQYAPKACQGCGKEYQPTGPRNVYCPACQNRRKVEKGLTPGRTVEEHREAVAVASKPKAKSRPRAVSKKKDPTPPAKRRRGQVKPPPSDPGDIGNEERYLSLLARLAFIQPPPDEVLDRMERMLAIDEQVKA